jgi:hypothetical protein
MNLPPVLRVSNRRPIALNEFLSPHFREHRQKCTLIAVDMIVYIDDSTAMSPKEFTGFKTFLRQFVRVFESDRGRCQRVFEQSLYLNLSA